MTPEQEKALHKLALGYLEPDQHGLRKPNWEFVALAQVLLELADRMNGVEAHPALSIPALDRDGGPDPIGTKAEPLQTGAFGCIGSVCQLGTLNRVGCTHESGCHLEILADRGIVAPPATKQERYQGPIEPGMEFYVSNEMYDSAKVRIVEDSVGLDRLALKVLSGAIYVGHSKYSKGFQWLFPIERFRDRATPASPTPEFAEVDEQRDEGEYLRERVNEHQVRNSEPQSRARVRDELAWIVARKFIEGRSSSDTVDRILDRLMREPSETSGFTRNYATGEWSRRNIEAFLDDVKSGKL